jgi:hypothetical protein
VRVIQPILWTVLLEKIPGTVIGDLNDFGISAKVCNTGNKAKLDTHFKDTVLNILSAQGGTDPEAGMAPESGGVREADLNHGAIETIQTSGNLKGGGSAAFWPSNLPLLPMGPIAALSHWSACTRT